MEIRLPRCCCALLALFLGAGYPTLPAAGPYDLVFAGSERVAPNIIRIPFTLTGTLITLRGRVGAVEGNFIFDTGAKGLVLNHRYFGRQMRWGSHGAAGVTGAVRVTGSAQVDTFQLADLRLLDAEAGCVDLSHIEAAKNIDLAGLIGCDLFHDFEVLFDYGSSRLVLIRIDARGNPLEEVPDREYRRVSSFPVEIAGHVAVVAINFGGRSVRDFGLDCGAEQNLLSLSAGPRFLKENFEIRRRFLLRGTGPDAVEVLGGVLRHARIDTMTLGPMATLLTNLNEINALCKARLDGILGYEFLSQRPVSINYRKRRLTFYNSLGS